MVSREFLSGLSDEAFYQRLKLNQASRTWTVGDLFELERRGFDLLKKDPILQGQLEKVRDDHVATIKATFEAIGKGAKLKTQSLIARLSTSAGVAHPVLTFPTSSLQAVIGPIAPEVSNLEIENPKTDLALFAAGFENLDRSMSKIVKSLRRDLVFWIIATSTVISAITSICILVLTINPR